MKKQKQAHGGTLSIAEPGDVLNPYGRPKKMVSQVLADLREAGAEPITPSQVSDVISVLLNLRKEDVLKIAENKELPLFLQRTARRFIGASDKDWDKLLSDSLDRAHGKATSRVEHSGNLAFSGGNVADSEKIEALRRIAESE